VARLDSVEYRLLTLRLLLQWEGYLNRSRVANLLELGDVRASQWIQEFRNQYPSWLEWNAKSKSYHATYEAFKGMNSKNNAISLSKYLSLVNTPHVISDSEDFVCSAFPELSTPDPEIFSGISTAIRYKSDISVLYRSMSEPKSHERLITPHHLVRVGRRWHMRGYCSLNHDFRDYSLGRIVKLSILNMSKGKPESEDARWNKLLNVRLIAHPELTIDQEDVIKYEYFEGTSSRVVSCRAALVGYFIQDIRAATDISNHKPPEYQIAISNIEEILPWMFK